MKAVYLLILCLTVVLTVEAARYRFWTGTTCGGQMLTDVSPENNQCFKMGSGYAKISQINSTYFSFSEICDSTACNSNCRTSEVKNGNCNSASGFSYMISSNAVIAVPTLIVFAGLLASLLAF
eukprot:TRINITY_DN656_c0_g1_i2.p1 TRINITY_DN656_c0_g1~~TRINITY_DN656_c0_g1_i2.p1  ORF type:complete len:123 (-),score=34.22 TRINITY_DN656_c0_g1_i2:66-434(-)